MLDEWKTLTGVPAGEIGERLAEPFEDAGAYKPISGGTAGAAGLTDIDTAWMIKRLNEVFGPYGLGWTLDWDAEDVIISGEPKRPTVAVRRAEFTYLLVDEGGNERFCGAPCSGGSQNELPFALKGMETSAIGNAVSKMRFQELVYMGKLSHRNVREFLKGGKRGSGADGKSGDKAEAKKRAGEYSCGDFVVPIGKHQGKRLADLNPEVVNWYARSMKVTTGETEQLQRMAIAYLKLLKAPA
jgi:uncharacterized protein (DUF3820 family)